VSNYVSLLGAEDVALAGRNISGAADQMERAASSMDSFAERLIRALDDHAMRVNDSSDKMAGPAPRPVILLRRIHMHKQTPSVEKIGKGLFLQWGVEYEEFENGPGNYTVAIVELPDGSVESFMPNCIKFEVAS
jgi:hypothetical protein